jgi:hypothetical protein
MRRRNCARAALLCALAATAAVPATASAAPRHDDGLTIASTPNDIVAGTGVLIYGQLKGSDVADQTIHLYHRIAPAANFTIISTTKTDQDGFYEFTRADGVVITNRDWFAEGPSATHSKTIRERVSSTLTLNESTGATTTGTKVLFSGTVYPAHTGQEVLIQEQDSTFGSGWKTIAEGRTNAASSFTIAKAVRDAGDYTLRAYLPADARNIAGSSDSTTLEVQQTQNPSFTINSSNPAVITGSPVTISGTEYLKGSSTVPDPAQTVSLYAKSVNGSFKEVSSTTTGADGSYSFSETPSNNSVYKVLGSDAKSANLYEAVTDTVSLTAGGSSTTVGSALSFTGTVSPDHTGHSIYLQIQTARGGWQDVDATQVGSGSNYAFSYRFGEPGTYTVRTRIFGGPENVGAGSTPVTITVSGYAAASTLPAPTV